MLLRFGFLALFAGVVHGQTLPTNARFVMSHFKSDGGGGDERLYVSWSPDGLDWRALNNGQPVWQPPRWEPFWNVVRDPAIIFHDGYYWVAYTAGNYGRGANFGLVRSADLLNWTDVGPVNIALPGATAQFTWSPIFFTDGDGSVHVIVATSPTGSSTFELDQMRVHETHPLNAEWTQWSIPVPLELPDLRNNDCWIWKEGATYHAAYADFDRGGAVVHATSQHLITGWVRDKVLGYNSQEGNIVLPLPDGGYRLYLETGNGPGGVPSTYRTCDFTAEFTAPTPQVSVISDVPIRNGKLCAAHAVLPLAGWEPQAMPALLPTQRTPLADPEADGLNNLLEHALGTSPTAFTPPARRPQPWSGLLPAGLYPGVRFDWFPSSADVSVRVEASADGAAWTMGGLVVEANTLLSNGLMRTYVRAAEPMERPMLLRVRATQAATSSAQALSAVSSTETKAVRRPVIRKPPRRYWWLRFWRR